MKILLAWTMILSSFFHGDASEAAVFRLYVESKYDTDGDGRLDCIQLLVFLPRPEGLFPTVLLANPYGMGTGSDREYASDGSSSSIIERSRTEYCRPSFDAMIENLWLAESDFALIRALLKAGYAVAACAGPGTFGSEGWNLVLEEAERIAWNCIASFLSGERTAFLETSGGRYTDAFWSDGRLLFFGHSYGGAIGLRLVRKDPDLFEAMILSSPVADWYSWYQGALRYTDHPVSDLSRFVSSKVFEKKEWDAYQDALAVLDAGARNGKIFEDRSALDVDPSCPVLLVQGVVDDVVGTAPVYSLFSRLEERDVPVSLVLHGRGHQFPLMLEGFDSFLLTWMSEALEDGTVPFRVAEYFKSKSGTMP